MSEIDPVALEVEILDEDAERDIAKAVSARHSIARKYVLRLRRRHPDATPAEVIQMLERHYVTSISTAGAVIAAGAIAAEVGIALIPVGGAAAAGVKSAGRQAAKKAGTEAAKVAARRAAKRAAKTVALGAARTGAQRAVALLPAGDEQLQFEITAVFGLAIADIHGMRLDQDQAHALVYGLSNGRVSQQQIATMAKDVASSTPVGVVGVGRRIASGRTDWSHWATTLAETLPAGAARSLVQTIQTGQLDTVRANLDGRRQTAIEYGVGAVAGGVTRFVFGREVIAAARTAFAEAPEVFPPHLAVPVKAGSDTEGGAAAPRRALAAVQQAARATGGRIAGVARVVGSGVATGATAVGSGVAAGAGAVGSGVATGAAVVGAGAANAAGAVTGAAGAVGGRVAGLVTPKRSAQKALPRRDDDVAPGDGSSEDD